MKLKFEIKTDELPAFGGYLSGSAIKGIAEIKIDTNNTVLACADNDIDFYELMAENTVHEMLHAFQDLYKKAFSEEEVENAIEQAKEYLKDNR